jgi:hypothetical protein
MRGFTIDSQFLNKILLRINDIASKTFVNNMFKKLLHLLFVAVAIILQSPLVKCQPVPCNICKEGTITRYWGFIAVPGSNGRKIVRSCSHIYYMWFWYGAPSSETCTAVQDDAATKRNCGCV